MSRVAAEALLPSRAMPADSWVAVAAETHLMGRVVPRQPSSRDSEQFVPPMPAPIHDPAASTVRLQHVNAIEVADMLAEIADGRIAVWVSPATNSVLLRGSAENVSDFLELVARLDVPEPPPRS